MIRPTDSEDWDAVHLLLDAAFSPSRYESELVRSIHGMEETFYDWVFESEGRAVAYILYTLAFRGEEPIGWHLAPVAVDPEFQNKGIGSQLISNTLNEEPIYEQPVFVLGDPAYYERFGFQELATAKCPYDSGNQHFRALHWRETKEAFTIGYSEAFKKAEKVIMENPNS